MANERLAPDAIAAQTNLTGAVTDIDDDPDAPDANWLSAPGNNNNTEVRVTFPSPSGNPTTGAGLQEFRVQVRKTNHPTDPTCALELWENGALVATVLAAAAVSSTGGLVLSASWDASQLGTADGSLVECRVAGSVGGGNPANRASLEVGAVEWNAEVAAAGNNFTISGAVTVTPAVAATADFTRNAALAGAVALTPTPAAALDFTLNAALAGAVAVSPGVAAGMSFGRDFVLAGAVAVTPAVGAALDFTANAALAGAVTVTPSVAALLARNIHPALAGSLALGSTVAAAMTFTASGGSIAGLVSVAPTIAALLAHNVHPALAGGLGLGVTPVAAGLIFAGSGSAAGRSALAGEVERTALAGRTGPSKLTGEVG